MDHTMLQYYQKLNILIILQVLKVLSLHYDGSNNFLFVNSRKEYQFKFISEIKLYPLCLGNVSKNFTFDNMKRDSVK